MAVSDCCLKTFEWNGTPTGRIDRLGSNDTYIAVPNVRLLTDHYAREARATVYVPDFFGGEVLPFEPVLAGRFGDVDVPGFLARNSRQIREPEIFKCATELRTKHDTTVAVGFCYGGWAVCRLGAEDPTSALVDQKPLVDAITVAHPSLLTEEDIDGVVVPVQILAPERDPVFTPELKSYTFDSLQRRGVPFDWQHFPRVEHACMTRGDPNKPGERAALERGKNAVVSWVRHIALVK